MGTQYLQPWCYMFNRHTSLSHPNDSTEGSLSSFLSYKWRHTQVKRFIKDYAPSEEDRTHIYPEPAHRIPALYHLHPTHPLLLHCAVFSFGQTYCPSGPLPIAIPFSSFLQDVAKEAELMCSPRVPQRAIQGIKSVRLAVGDFRYPHSFQGVRKPRPRKMIQLSKDALAVSLRVWILEAWSQLCPPLQLGCITLSKLLKALSFPISKWG